LSHKKDGGIIRYQITKGEGYSTPNEGAIVEGMSLIWNPLITSCQHLFFGSDTINGIYKT
jgi:hypothetical protein